eukprot:4684046-Pleurochrysis_carterae.AAC.2
MLDSLALTCSDSRCHALSTSLPCLKPHRVLDPSRFPSHPFSPDARPSTSPHEHFRTHPRARPRARTHTPSRTPTHAHPRSRCAQSTAAFQNGNCACADASSLPFFLPHGSLRVGFPA